MVFKIRASVKNKLETLQKQKICGCSTVVSPKMMGSSPFCLIIGLGIETGKCQKSHTGKPLISAEKRICKYCSFGEVDNEHHFLFSSSLHYITRGFFHCLYSTLPMQVSDFTKQDPVTLGKIMNPLGRER